MTAAQAHDVVHIEQTERGTWVRVHEDGSRSTPYGSREAAEGRKTAGKSAAVQLVEMARSRYSFGRTPNGDAFAVEKDGPGVVRLLRGGSRSLRSELAGAFYEKTGKTAGQGALTEAMEALGGLAGDADVEQVHLRVAPVDDGLLIDLGGDDGRCIEVVPGEGWSVLARQDAVLFRRTKLTGILPEPEDGGSLDELRQLINVTDRDWPQLLGWLVAALIPSLAHPIALLTGEQGTGKTTAGRLLVGLVDPSAVPLRASPRDEQGWGVAASASWVVGIDNVSSISAWLSDAMCRAVTGDGMVSRELYTNDDVHLLEFRRVLLLTSIAHGGIRGDLAERLLTVELERIAPSSRRTDRELEDAYARAHPRILGALLDLTSDVLAVLPGVQDAMTERPRMAGFAEILAALDRVRGTDSLGDYLRAGERLSHDVVDSDPVGAALLEHMSAQDYWTGPASALLTELTRRTPSGIRHWPASPKALSERLTRLAPALVASGIDVGRDRTGATRVITLTRRGPDEPAQGAADDPQQTPEAVPAAVGGDRW